jgi:hypothetical protein
MKTAAVVLCAVILAAAQTHGADTTWYSGDERCPPPKDDGTYSSPYSALDHRTEYPIFPGADKPGWSCSYQREDGIIVQFGDSRTPQQQWLALWGDNLENK